MAICGDMWICVWRYVAICGYMWTCEDMWRYVAICGDVEICGDVAAEVGLLWKLNRSAARCILEART